MISRPLHGRLSFRFAGIGAATLAALAVTLFSASSAKAQSPTQISEAQADINAQLVASRKTIATAPSATLALAVANAVQVGDTDTSITPADYVIAALSPIGGKVSATQKAAAPTIAGDVINKLIIDGATPPTSASANSIPFTQDVAEVVDGELTVGGTSTTLALTLAQREATLKAALSAVSGGPILTATGGALSTMEILNADQAIGKTLASDALLQTLKVSPANTNGLITLFDTAIAGVDGPRGTSALLIPQAAGQFVTGIVLSNTTTGALPDGLTPLVFAQDLIRPLAANASAAEYIANALTLDQQTVLTTLEDGLITSFPADVAKITQGLAASITAAQGEAGRLTFISTTANANITKATTVLEGGVFTDPYYAAEFTSAVGNDIYNSVNSRGTATGHALLGADAAGIVAGISAILGQDGASLAEVSGTFAQAYIATGEIPVARAATLATSFLTSAVNSKLPAADFINSQVATSSGGTFNIGTLVPRAARTGIPAANVIDMEAIADQFASAIIENYSNPLLERNTISTAAGATAVATDIGVLARDIAAITGLEQFSPSLNVTEYVAAAIAGSLTKTIEDFDLGSTQVTIGRTSESVQTLILADLQTDLKAYNTAATGLAIANAVTSGSNDVSYGVNPTGYTSITAPETPITNL